MPLDSGARPLYLGAMRPSNLLDPVAERKPPPLVQLAFRTTEEQRDGLEAEAKRRGIDISSLMRGIIAEFLAAARRR